VDLTVKERSTFLLFSEKMENSEITIPGILEEENLIIKVMLLESMCVLLGT
jgi:hypothetical protein